MRNVGQQKTFESRDVNDFGVPVVEQALVVGEVYWTVSFFDERMFLSELRPMTYVGALRVGNKLQHSFRDLSDESINEFGREEIAGIYEFEDALNVLLECSLRRRGVGR